MNAQELKEHKGLVAQLTEAKAEIERLKALANCALELRDWFEKHEFWNDESSEDIFPILQKYGLVEEIEYDPNLHGFVDNADPGDPIWHFIDFTALKESEKG